MLHLGFDYGKYRYISPTGAMWRKIQQQNDDNEYYLFDHQFTNAQTVLLPRKLKQQEHGISQWHIPNKLFYIIIKINKIRKTTLIHTLKCSLSNSIAHRSAITPLFLSLLLCVVIPQVLSMSWLPWVDPVTHQYS